MGGYLGSPGDGSASPLLVSVYVRDGYRGSEMGITDVLAAKVEEWARG
jgi:hypothetical protein